MQRVVLPCVSSTAVPTLLAAALLAATVGVGAVVLDPVASDSQSSGHLKVTSQAEANAMRRKGAACFVPNIGQWQHHAKFMHRSGPMTLFLEERGWVLDLVERPAEPVAGRTPDLSTAKPQEVRGVALRMTFEGDARIPEVSGEQKLPGHHNYFLGNDEGGWRTGVPLYGSVRYQNLYRGIDLRLRDVEGMPEYDLLLQGGADLSQVAVRVEGARGLSLRADGSLVIETELGPVTQPRPRTWQVGADGGQRQVDCAFVLLGSARFGFEASGWDGDTDLVIDPGLVWSTFLGGSGEDRARVLAVDGSGVVTLAGWTGTSNFPTTSGAYDMNYNNAVDVFVSRLDPSKTGAAQLLSSTFLGGSSTEYAYALSADSSGVVTLAGGTSSSNFPTSSGAFDTTRNSGGDVFVSRLDFGKTGSAQLIYSTFLGGSGADYAYGVFADASGVVTVAGRTASTNFPMASGYDTTHNGGMDVYLTRLDPSKTGSAQLIYSTFLGGSGDDALDAIAVDSSGVVTLAGDTPSANFPTTSGAYDTTHNGQSDMYVSRLDPSKTGTAQLTYSTFLGGSAGDSCDVCVVDAGGVVTASGSTASTDFPTTSGVYDATHNGGSDGFVIRLDPSKTGAAQLIYSTFLGGSNDDSADAVSADASGMITVAGSTDSTDFPTTSDAHDTTHNGQDDVFVCTLDPSKTGSAQMGYSTFLGGSGDESADALSVAASGVVTVAGRTSSSNFPVAGGAYDTTFGGVTDAYASKIELHATLYADVHEISISTGGTQKLTVNAGQAHANRSYWIFGSVTGTSPGVTLVSAIGAVTIPLNPDVWTDFTIALANTATLTNTRSTLGATGTAQASINLPKTDIPEIVGLIFHHAYLVYDASNNYYMASNAVPLKLIK